MAAAARQQSVGTKALVWAIVAGGLVAGTVDLTQACLLNGWDIPLFIAAGLLGIGAATNGNAGVYLLGVLLHFFIAGSAATIYCLASRRLPFLADYPLVCGVFFGVAVEDVMRFIVLPLSQLHGHGPYETQALVLGIVGHAICVGLPIAYCCWFFTRKRAALA